MSIAYSVLPIRIRTSPKFRYPSTSVGIRCSNADGPLRRPVAPAAPPKAPAPTLSPPPSVSAPTASPQKPITPSQSSVSQPQGVVTLEFQRKMAKELQEYFKQKKLEEASQGPFFGFVAKNEISNGRWAMFGFAVGLLTEYATGSNFVQQLKILFSNFGIVDLD